MLGTLEVSAGDGALKVGGPKQRAMLAHLILHANRPVSIEGLIDGLAAPSVTLIRSDGSQVFESLSTGSEPSWRPEGP